MPATTPTNQSWSITQDLRQYCRRIGRALAMMCHTVRRRVVGTQMAERLPHYRWSSDDGKLAVSLRADVVARLNDFAVVGHHRLDTGCPGILLGNVSAAPQPTVFVESFKPARETATAKDLLAEWRQEPGRRLYAVGLFWLISGSNSDWKEAHDWLHGSSADLNPGIFLMLEPAISKMVSGKLFFREGPDSDIRLSCVIFDLEDGSADAPPRSGFEPTTPPPGPSVGRKPTAFFPVPVWLIGILISGALLGALGIRSVVHRIHPGPAALAEVPVPGSNIGLSLERRSGELVLTWDRTAPEILSARSSMLQIRESNSRYELDLDPAQLQMGHYVYVPKGTDVTFGLQITHGDGTVRKETLRYISRVADSGR